MATWNEPKSNYVATDEVKPSIFNEFAENEKYLKQTQDIKITSAEIKDKEFNEAVIIYCEKSVNRIRKT